ncbi:helix-turn-helix domain-containing protein [Modicisalibacter luteus]|uniref:Helix-turn-helix domain-containing protein n=1 Tax=Modicisalibacter luteus TaxID=453962 RepID=A0ABV7M525_9GAMM|nr:helix-turn-helix domain-containing protein [Halomonas lutea]GHA88654.1 hypothetical protein GCM10007159_07630 [Halomonas lutea]
MENRQLTQKQRYQIFPRIESGTSQRQIASEQGIHSSTISQEIRHNTSCQGYDQEHALSDRRRRLAWKAAKHLPNLVR